MSDPDAANEARSLLGRRLAAYRRAAGYSQHQFASLVSYTRSSIGNVETGRQRPPRDFWKRCDDLFNTGGVLAADHDAIQRREREQYRDTARSLSAGGRLAPVLEPENRSAEANYHFSSLHVGLTADLFPLGDNEPHPNNGFLKELSFAERAELLLKLFLELDDEKGGDVLFLPLSRFVADMAQEVEYDPSTRLSVFGQLSQLTGWLALDGNRQGAARRYWNTAVYAAHEADEPALAASSLAYMSLQDTYQRRTKSALSLARTAFEMSDGSVTRLTKTMLATRLARAHAAMGNRKASLYALDTAKRTFAGPGEDPEPVWVSYVDEIEVAAQAGACYLELRMAKEARRALEQALHMLETTAPHRARDAVHYLARLAKCDLLDYEVERACATATGALHRASAIGSARMVARLQEFCDALEPFGNNRAAQDFRELFVTGMRRP